MKINILIILLSNAFAQAQNSINILVKRDTFQYFTILDNDTTKYKLPTSFKKPVNWQKADQSRKGFFRNWYGSYNDSFNLKQVLAIIDTAIDLSQIQSAQSWCIDNYFQAFPYLITRLSNKQKIGLINTADLIIWDRIKTGDLEFYGHGGIINEDLFTIAGRASWILNQITGENFATVHGNLTKEQAKEFKQLWEKYLANLSK